MDSVQAIKMAWNQINIIFFPPVAPLWQSIPCTVRLPDVRKLSLLEKRMIGDDGLQFLMVYTYSRASLKSEFGFNKLPTITITITSSERISENLHDNHLGNHQ